MKKPSGREVEMVEVAKMVPGQQPEAKRRRLEIFGSSALHSQPSAKNSSEPTNFSRTHSHGLTLMSSKKKPSHCHLNASPSASTIHEKQATSTVYPAKKADAASRIQKDADRLFESRRT